MADSTPEGARGVGRRRFLAAGTAGAAALLTIGGARPHPPGSEPLVGSWFGRIQVETPPPPPTLDSFDSFMTFHADGTVVESRRYYFADLLETTGHGAWAQEPDGRYRAFFRFGVQLAPPSTGSLVGTDNVRMQLTHDPGRDTLAGTFSSEIRAQDGTVLLTASGTVTAERIQA